MSNPGLNINKAFREQVKINLPLTFDFKSMVPIRKNIEEMEQSYSFTSDVLLK